MSDGKKTEELACPGFDCQATVVVTVDQIAERARVRCANGHEFMLGGSAQSDSPTSEDEWRRSSKKTIRLEHGKKKD
ncbi:MAG: hypothetical protein JWM74_3746 [Myxococcaceae bacterium]|jgi:hypothetical protein|nr:hypothetical protein [Myxococcaceae bacterium]